MNVSILYNDIILQLYILYNKTVLVTTDAYYICIANIVGIYNNMHNEVLIMFNTQIESTIT